MVDIFNSQEEVNYARLHEQALVNRTHGLHVIGFDLEAISRKNYPVSYAKHVHRFVRDYHTTIPCLLQISTRTGYNCVINLLNDSYPKAPHAELLKILSSKNWVKVGVGVERDLEMLSVVYNLGHLQGGVDLQPFALQKGHTRPGLSALSKIYCPEEPKPSESIMSWRDWSTRLTGDALAYAVKDAELSLKIYDRMVLGLVPEPEGKSEA